MSRPLSSAANFFRRNGGSEKADTPESASPVRAPRATTRVLECQPEERELLRTSVIPSIVDYLGKNALKNNDLFLKDPSIETQEAMMGLASGPREPVRALRELLDARYSHNESSVFSLHDSYIWAIALKFALKELSRPLIPLDLAVSLLDLEQYDSQEGKLEYLKRSFVPDCPNVVQDIFHLLQDCPSNKERLGAAFSILLFLAVTQEDANYARLSESVRALSDATQFIVMHASDVFGASPFESYKPVGGAPTSKNVAPPPPPPPLRPTVSSDQGYDEDETYAQASTATPQTPQVKGLFNVVCVFDFDPVEPDELELRVGDSVSVLSINEDGWYRGRLVLPDGTAEEGVFPANYVKKDEVVEPFSFTAPPPQPSPKASKTSPPPPPPQPSNNGFKSSAPPPPPPPVQFKPSPCSSQVPALRV